MELRQVCCVSGRGCSAGGQLGCRSQLDPGLCGAAVSPVSSHLLCGLPRLRSFQPLHMPSNGPRRNPVKR